MKYEDLIDWALETNATFSDIQNALEHWGFNDSYDSVCEFIENLKM
jgi:virulence-associated protein VapD